jgi:hypothetical protein
MGDSCAFLLHSVRPSPALAMLPIGARSNRGKITVKAVFACTCTWSSSPLPVGLRSQTALMAILLGFNNGRAGRMAPFAYARRFAAPSCCGELRWGSCLGGRRGLSH